MNIEGIPKRNSWANVEGIDSGSNLDMEKESEALPLIHDFNGASSSSSTGNVTPIASIDMNTAYAYISSAAIIGIFIGYAICHYKFLKK